MKHDIKAQIAYLTIGMIRSGMCFQNQRNLQKSAKHKWIEQLFVCMYFMKISCGLFPAIHYGEICSVLALLEPNTIIEYFEHEIGFIKIVYSVVLADHCTSFKLFTSNYRLNQVLLGV